MFRQRFSIICHEVRIQIRFLHRVIEPFDPSSTDRFGVAEFSLSHAADILLRCLIEHALQHRHSSEVAIRQALALVIGNSSILSLWVRARLFP